MGTHGYIPRLPREDRLGDDERMNLSTRPQANHAADLKALYPALSDHQITEVERRLTQYVSIVLRLMSYIGENPTAYPQALPLRNDGSDLRSDPGDFDLN